MFKKSSILIELLVSAAILTIGLTAGVALTGHYFQMMNYNKNKIIATYLAARELELVRCQRDTNYYQKKDWKDGFNNSEHGETALLLDANNNKYNYTSGNPTVFKEKLEILYGGNFVKITATVNWDKGSVVLTETLYNWKTK